MSKKKKKSGLSGSYGREKNGFICIVLASAAIRIPPVFHPEQQKGLCFSFSFFRNLKKGVSA